MEVICKGHENCINRLWCSHSKPHELDITTINYCHTDDDVTYLRSQPNTMCKCSSKYIRLMKLKKLKML